MSKMGTLRSETKMHNDAQRKKVRGHEGRDEEVLKLWVQWGGVVGEVRAFKAPAGRD